MDSLEIEHKDNIPFWQAPVPRRWHKCSAQTRGWSGLNFVERCACGAIRFEGCWIERNSRRKKSRS